MNNTCSICGSPTLIRNTDLQDSRFGIRGLFSVDWCRSCGHCQMDPLPDSDTLRDLYEIHYNFRGQETGRYDRLRSFLFSSYLYRLWMSIDGDISFYLKKGRGLLLDVGCNQGRGLDIYTGNGFKVEGLELNRVAAAEAQNRGYPVWVQTLETLSPGERYDVVVLSNVLEHSLDPFGMLSAVNSLLKKSGEVWISCPNNKSWLRSLFGKYWINWHVPFHLSHFSSNSLQRLLDRTNFEVMGTRYETPSLWAAQSVIARLFSKPGEPTRQLRAPLLVASLMLLIRIFLFPALWIGNRLGRGDCLVVTARKR